MPSVMEARVARARKIPYQERDLAQSVAESISWRALVT